MHDQLDKGGVFIRRLWDWIALDLSRSIEHEDLTFHVDKASHMTFFFSTAHC